MFEGLFNRAAVAGGGVPGLPYFGLPVEQPTRIKKRHEKPTTAKRIIDYASAR
jgi:hypothetical protein